MTWKEAIRKVLLDEGGPLHYTDITTRIFENGYKGKADSDRMRSARHEEGDFQAAWRRSV